MRDLTFKDLLLAWFVYAPIALAVSMAFVLLIAAKAVL